MSLSPGRAVVESCRVLSFYISLALLVLLVPASLVHAQGGTDFTGTGGKHKVQGRIYFPSGRRSDVVAVKVTLESTSSERLSVIADLNGNFAFTSIAPGSYTVTVDAGKDYEIARESLYIESTPKSRTMSSSDIALTDVARTFNVIINLQLKRNNETESRPEVLNAALANVPRPAVELYDKAVEAARAGDSAKAIEQLRAAISYYPEFAIAFNEMGVQYLRLGQAEKAVAAFRDALKFKSEDFTMRLNYGISLLETREFTEAESQLRQAIKKNDDSWGAHMYLGVALIRLRKYDEAEKELKRSLEIGGENLSRPHYYLGGIYWGRGELKRAADELEKYVRLAPKAPDAERVRVTIKDLRSKQS